MFKAKNVFLTLATSFVLLGFSVPSYSAEAKSPLITESYYRIKWGYFDEFMDLFKKNHYPILKALQESGHIESIVVDIPVNHASEDARWDVRVTIVVPDTAALAREMGKVSKRIYPDQDKLKEDELQRFRLMTAHQDIMIRREDISAW